MKIISKMLVVLMGVCNALPVGLLVQLLVYSRYA
jgi:amino acid exporter